jgi:hypothetical protein
MSEMIERIPCKTSRCGFTILPSTAKETGGFCAPCSQQLKRDMTLQDFHKLKREKAVLDDAYIIQSHSLDKHGKCLKCGMDFQDFVDHKIYCTVEWKRGIVKFILGASAVVILIASGSFFFLNINSAVSNDRTEGGRFDLATMVTKKAIPEISHCKSLGDRPFSRRERILVWDVDVGGNDSAISMIKNHALNLKEKEPATIFLISSKRQELVGIYSVSGQPAYREWVEVYVINFNNIDENGDAVSCHEIVSNDPRQTRAVERRPEVGDPSPPIAAWVESLPVNFAPAEKKWQ